MHNNTREWGTKKGPFYSCEEGCICKRHNPTNKPVSQWHYTSREKGESFLIDYPDTGCPEVSDSCFTCPLSECQYVDMGPYLAWKAKNADSMAENQALEIIDLQADGLSIKEICAKTGAKNARALQWRVTHGGYRWEGKNPFRVREDKNE